MTEEVSAQEPTNAETTLYTDGVAPEATAPVTPEGTQQEGMVDTLKEGETKETVEYKLNLPEKNPFLGQEDVERIISFARDRGLSNDDAQKLLDGEVDRIVQVQERIKEDHAKRSEVWVSELRQDDDFGGERFDANVGFAKKVITKFGDETLIKALDESGLGNFPPLVKMMSRIGKAMSDDSLILSGQAPGRKKSMEEIFYGSN